MNICPNHQEYKVPLIWTFAFNGAEFWCPYCDHKTGMFGDTEESDAVNDAELQARLDVYKKASDDYLGAHKTMVCSSLEWPRGSSQWIKPSELPAEEIARCVELRKNGWKLGIKAEALEVG